MTTRLIFRGRSAIMLIALASAVAMAAPAQAASPTAAPDRALTYSAGWRVQAGPPPGSDTVHVSRARGATATLAFRGIAVELYGTLAPSNGRADLRLDGRTIRQIDLYAPNSQPRHMLWSSGPLAARDHVLTVTVLGRHSARSSGNSVMLAAARVSEQPPAGEVTPPPAAGPFVTRSGAALQLNGKPFLFTGSNMYEALSDGSSTRGCGADMMTGDRLATALRALGRPSTAGSGTVLRVWFFQRYAVKDGVRDWTYLDKAVSVAKAAGYLLIPVLGNEWTDCEVSTAAPAANWLYGQRRSPRWYQSGYRETPDAGAVSTYRAWVAEATTRYRGESAIAFWQLMNEAESANADDGTYGVTLLRRFADDVGQLVKSSDPNHLLSFGTIGSGQNGAPGDNYTTIHASPYIDLAEVHDYSTASTVLDGDSFNGLALRVQQARELNKPIFVGEFGNQLGSPSAETLERRAALFDAKLSAYFASGFTGALQWNYTAFPVAGTYDISATDPAMAVLLRHGTT